MVNIVLKDGAGDETVYHGIKTLTVPTEGGGTQTFEIAQEKKEKTVDLDMLSGNQEIMAEEDTVLTKVTVIKPSALIPENIRSGVSIGGVQGNITTPKLSAPTVTSSVGANYNTHTVINPSDNGSYPTELRCYIDGEQITVKTPPAPGAGVDVADVSLYNGKDGKQTVKAEYAAPGFETSDACEIEVDMVGIEVTPETIDDKYDYPALKTGSTYNGIISEKQKSNGFLPPKISVKMGGKDCPYTWDNDTGYSTDTTSMPLPTRCKNAAISVPNVNEKLTVDIPYTEEPKLNSAKFSVESGRLFVVPPPYANRIKVKVDGIELSPIVGITYTHSGGFSVGNGGCYYDMLFGSSAKSCVKCRISLQIPEDMEMTVRCVNYFNSAAYAYGMLSKMDTAFSDSATTESTSDIQKSFVNSAVTGVQLVTYAASAGEHFFDVKRLVNTTSSVSGSFGFIPYMLCPKKDIVFSDYDEHTVSVIPTGDGCEDGDEVITVFQMKPHISYENYMFHIGNIVSGVTEIQLYLDDEMIDAFSWDGNSDFTKDMRSYTDHPGKHRIYAVLLGDGVNKTTDSALGYINPPPIYGVSGLYQSSPDLTRTDDAVGLSFTKNTDGTIQSDFDSLFPWNEAKQVTDENGNMFIQMPAMYFRIDADSSCRLTSIAVSAAAGDTGNWYRVEPFCYGRYTTNYNGKTALVSKPGIKPTAGATRTNLRAYARNNGTGYQINDLYHKTVMKFLWWIEWATKNAASVMTGLYNGSGGSGVPTTGATDHLATPSGYETTRGQMRWHYIEDFVGGISEILDGACVLGLSGYSYATADPAKFADSYSGMNRLAYPNPTTNTRCISAYGWDANNPFLCLPREIYNATSYTTYFCTSSQNYSSSYYVPLEGCSYNWSDGGSGQARNGFAYRSMSTSTAGIYYGCRLIYHGTLE